MHFFVAPIKTLLMRLGRLEAREGRCYEGATLFPDPPVRFFLSRTLVALTLLAVAVAPLRAQPMLLVDMETLEVLYEQDAGQPWYPASLTKLMTAFVTFEAIGSGKVGLDDSITISSHAASEPPSSSGLKPGSALIDIGINRVDGKTVGDADFESCSKVAGWITPVPGGVGPVTVATLMKNAVLATRMQMDHYRSAFAAAS